LDIQAPVLSAPFPESFGACWHSPQHGAAQFPFPKPPYKVFASGIGEVWENHRVRDVYDQPPILTQDQVADLYARDPAVDPARVARTGTFIWLPPFSAHTPHFHADIITVDPSGILPRPRVALEFSSKGSCRMIAHGADWWSC
jgi:hypothetical protein